MNNWQITTRPEENKIILELNSTLEAFTIQDVIEYASLGILNAKTSDGVQVPQQVQDRIAQEAREAREYPRL